MRTLDIQIKIHNYQTLIQSQCINIKQLRIKNCPNIYIWKNEKMNKEKKSIIYFFPFKTAILWEIPFLVLEVFGAIMQFLHTCAD